EMRQVVAVKGDIVLIGEEIDEVGIEFSSSCIEVLGDGGDIRFWFDRWVDNRRLCDRFPRSIRTLGGDGEFVVKELARLIEEKVLRVENGVHETLWNNLVPKKVNVFMWRALRGRISVRKRDIDLDSVLCPCCNNIMETLSATTSVPAAVSDSSNGYISILRLQQICDSDLVLYQQVCAFRYNGPASIHVRLSNWYFLCTIGMAEVIISVDSFMMATYGILGSNADISQVRPVVIPCILACSSLVPILFEQRIRGPVFFIDNRFGNKAIKEEVSSYNTCTLREHGRMILESIEHGPLIWHTIEENGVTRTKKYEELSATEKIQANYDLKATNIILQGLPSDVYSLVNHHRVAKDLWERVQLLMQGTSLTKQERECKLYDAFDKFAHIKGNHFISIT
ncbi:integrase, catalytic region, zinc finger, CCHC-type containing protein, partial [Tanacetum coccineum]